MAFYWSFKERKKHKSTQKSTVYIWYWTYEKKKIKKYQDRVKRIKQFCSHYNNVNILDYLYGINHNISTINSIFKCTCFINCLTILVDILFKCILINISVLWTIFLRSTVVCEQLFSDQKFSNDCHAIDCFRSIGGMPYNIVSMTEYPSG